MKLSDIVSAMHLPIYAEVPLLVFMGIFVGVAVHLFGRRAEVSHMAMLPLRSDSPPRRKP
jgi:hypothetical protein